MNRRTFMLGGSAVAAVGAAGVAAWRIQEALKAPPASQPWPAPVEAARTELASLRFATGAFDAFARDLRAMPNPLLGAQYMGLTAGGLMLLSCDFFQHGADEQREIQYVTLFHPYARPCYSPFIFKGASAEP